MNLKIYSSTILPGECRAESIRRALNEVATDKVCGVVCCGITATEEYHSLLDSLKSTICEVLGKSVPVTLIPQYLLPNGGLSLDVYVLEEDAQIQIEEYAGICYGRITSKGEESLLFIEGIPATDFSASVKQQSREVFDKLDALLSAHGFAVDDIVRQWNYIGSIVSYRDGRQNYQEFNDARSSYYAKGGWQNGYPAATGIGTSGGGIIVGGIAFKGCQDIRSIYPIDNPLQVAAHDYSKRVLIDEAADAVKSTPKFERAKLIASERGACCFVSGTAAIRGEASVDSSSAREQTIMTIENIEYLVSKDNLLRYGCQPYDMNYRQLQVFIKNPEDYEEVRAVVEERLPQVKAIYTVADVCRRELLVEIEGILTT